MKPIAITSATQETRSTCPYCGVGCGVVIETRDGAVTGVRGDEKHPANFGRLCSKGSTLHLTARPGLQRTARLLTPELRATRGEPGRAVGWDEALDAVADRIAATIATHGPDSVGLYLSGQLLTEDYYVFNKLAKGLLGTNNVDTNSRLCMSSAVAGYKLTLGADAPPACYEDLDHADLLFIVGANPAFAHPILFRRIEDAKARNPALKIVVVDPRRTDTAESADLFVQIQPGSDVAFFHGMLHILLWEGLIDEAYIAAHTEGFAELKRLVRDYTPGFVAQTCGIDVETLTRAAFLFGRAKAALSLYCQGLNQSASGTAKNAALVNLHLATGQIGRPGAGPFSLTGQPNAMGGREVGGMANLLSAHRDLTNPEHRAEVARLWGVDDVPAAPGKTAVEMFEAVRAGEIRLLWIVCTNPAQSLPDQNLVRAALDAAECVIVQDAFTGTETARYADIVLPASSWAEKEGSVTNSERRISRVRPAIAAPGEARADWRIAVDVARRLEARLRPGRPTLFGYDDVEAVWNEHRETTRGRDLDITGLSYAVLDADGPQHWPCREGEAPVARLYVDGVFPTASGRARFAALPHVPVADAIDARHPFRLTTGRLRDQWHGMTRTGTLGRLFGHAPEPAIEMYAGDMARRGIGDGELVRVTSRRGAMLLPVRASNAVRSGDAFIPMHWGEAYVGGRDDDGTAFTGVNALTTGAIDPRSKQPELKHAAVRVEKTALPARVLAFGWFAEDDVQAVREALRAEFGALAYASCTPFGRDEPANAGGLAGERESGSSGSDGATDAHGPVRVGLLFRGAAERLPDGLLDRIERRFGLADDPVLRYDDARRGARRRMRLADGKLDAVLLAGDAATDFVAEGWLRDSLEAGVDARAFGRSLLMATPVAPAGIAPAGRTICNCLNVTQRSIEDFVAARCDEPADAVLHELKGGLRCGTQCGSCVPELKRLIDARSPVRSVA
ncbi:nitrate reductase [Derxia gummosa]|uniref:Nitrate reductase n=1 Tax=Derxia gummosa DSM 723 TaxID=1121388 RepID=A0A8B6X6B9_9BURK|nr:nitrate reductase [Derxia gummosa]